MIILHDQSGKIIVCFFLEIIIERVYNNYLMIVLMANQANSINYIIPANILNDYDRLSSSL